MSSDNKITNPSTTESFRQVCEKRFSRRDILKASSISGAMLALNACRNDLATQSAYAKDVSPTQRYDFTEISHGMDEYHHVAPDHHAQVLLRWGDPLFKDAPEFDPKNQTLDSQRQQFGYNNDYIGYLALQPKDGQDDRALLCVNHEYPSYGLMFPDFKDYSEVTAEQVRISQAASGNSIVEISKRDGQWNIEHESVYNRRIMSIETEMEMSGPVAGNQRLRTNADPSGKKVFGTFNNCAGGMTPWGTFLTCEENFNFCFGGELEDNHPEAENYTRYNVPIGRLGWANHDARFDIGQEPNEANRFGWVVEIDPLDPASKPKKRTALGRFKHEGGENIIASDGRLAIYMGDDQRFEYLYKFVSRDVVVQGNASANKDLLDHGTLYVAKFDDDGTIAWLPLTLDNPVLSEKFSSQADILIEPRKAADLLQATPMDRPEDVVPNSRTGKVYVMLTNNTKREQADAANPLVKNVFGHIIEINEHENNHSATKGTWEVLVQGGDPKIPEHRAKFHPETSENGWFGCPDNATVDPSGRLWVSTDQGSKSKLSGTNDGLWAVETEGELRGLSKMFFRVPNGGELTGPVFSDDEESLFLAIQHPGEIVGKSGVARYQTATTRWPDFDDDIPPRPSVVVVTRKGGGRIG